MSSIKIINSVSKGYIAQLGRIHCFVHGCTCDISFRYISSRDDIHKAVGDVLTIGTVEECTNGDADIMQITADGLVKLGIGAVIS